MTHVLNEYSEINEHGYYGPHKYIVCLLGSDDHQLTRFIATHQNYLEKTRNLSVSIMAFGTESLENDIIRDYRKLCYQTSEGLFVNVVDRGLKG